MNIQTKSLQLSARLSLMGMLVVLMTLVVLHALAAFPALAAMSLFEECYRELFPTATPLDALRAQSGQGAF